MDAHLWNREKDYPILASWWEAYHWEVVAKEILPDNGYIVSNSNEYIAAGFVYFTNNAPIAYADWFITNPRSKAKDRHNALNLIYKKIESECRINNCKIITSTITSKTLAKRMLRDHGYEVASHKVMQLMRVLDDDNIGFVDYFRDQEAIDKNSPIEERKTRKLKNLTKKEQDFIERLEKDTF